METARLTTNHDSAQHTIMNVLHVALRDIGQEAAGKQNPLRKPGDKIDIIGANPLTIGMITREELSTGDQEAKKKINCIDVGSDEEDYRQHFYAISVSARCTDSIIEQPMDEVYITLNIRPPHIKYRTHHTLHINIDSDA